MTLAVQERVLEYLREYPAVLPAPTIAKISLDTHLGISAVERAVQELEEAGVVTTSYAGRHRKAPSTAGKRGGQRRQVQLTDLSLVDALPETEKRG